VLNTTGAPCFGRAGDDPIPTAQEEFSAPGVRVNQVSTETENQGHLTAGAPPCMCAGGNQLPPAQEEFSAPGVRVDVIPPTPRTAFSVFEKIYENDKNSKNKILLTVHVLCNLVLMKI
jgi:hypothetical protein